MNDVESISARLQQRLGSGSFELPPFPAIAQRVIELSSDPESSAAAIAELVHRDPGLASELLRYANSAAIGGRIEIVSVQHAIAHLGIQRVGELSLSTSLRSGIYAATAYARLSKLYWRQSLATALYAKKVARELAANVELSFLCGLLWDVGASLVLHAIGEGSRRLPDEATADTVADQLARSFTTEAVASWSLPELVRDALMDSPDLEKRPAESDIAILAGALAGPLLEAPAPDAPQPGEAAELTESETTDALDPLATHPQVASLNLYPEQLAGLRECAETVRTELEAMP